jgi:acetyltransferase EpsM
LVEASAELKQGVQVFPHAYVGSDVSVGFGTIVNTAAVVSHDCKLDDYVNIAPGTLLAGGVAIEEGVLVGMGVSVNLNVQIGARAMVGNSAVVKADVPPNQIVRAGQIWPE